MYVDELTHTADVADQAGNKDWKVGRSKKVRIEKLIEDSTPVHWCSPK